MMGPTMTPRIGEIINFFQGRAIQHYFLLMLFPIIDGMWESLHNSIIVTLIPQTIHKRNTSIYDTEQ